MIALADVPADVRAVLDGRRLHRGEIVHPDNGDTWFSDDHCAMCGNVDDHLVNDHCHATGLFRGCLCHSCNGMEGRNHTAIVWQFWRVNAPGFDHREDYSSSWGSPFDRPYLSDAEVAGLPIADLLRLHDDRRSSHLNDTAVRASQFQDRLYAADEAKAS